MGVIGLLDCHCEMSRQSQRSSPSSNRSSVRSHRNSGQTQFSRRIPARSVLPRSRLRRSCRVSLLRLRKARRTHLGLSVCAYIHDVYCIWLNGTYTNINTIGLHFFNPVPVMKLVELISALQTSKETLDRARAFAIACGKGTSFL